MKQPRLEVTWPESWKQSFYYDQMEVFDHVEAGQEGYAYSYLARAENTLELIRSSVPSGAHILDVAAAQGNFSLRLAEAGYEVTWNDLRADLADYVRCKWEKGSLHYRPGNVLDFPQGAVQFDAILIAEVIEHVAHPDQFLRRIAGLVKPGGVIVMTTPNGGYFRNRLPRFSDFPDPSQFETAQFKPDSDGHIFLLHEDEVRRLADEAGLWVSDLRIFTNPLTQGHLKSRFLLPYIPAKVVNGLERLSGFAPTPIKRKMHAHLAALLRRKPTFEAPYERPPSSS